MERILIEFPHSHYCEKVRWSLDWKGLEWTSQRLVPGTHRYFTKKLAPATHLPILIDGPRTVQGSHDIVSYLDEKYPEKLLTPKQPDWREECLSMEKRLDSELGNPLLLIIYYWLFQHPKLLNRYYTNGMAIYKRSLFFLAYPLFKKIVTSKYNVTEDTYDKAMRSVEGALDKLDEKLSHSSFMIGDEPSRLDICTATILSALCRHKHHPVRWDDKYRPQEVIDFYEKQKHRPCFQWSHSFYEKYRPNIKKKNLC